VLKELGLASEIKGRVIHKAGLAGGLAAIASGEAEVGIFPKSEIVAFDGITLVGSLPPSLATQYRLRRRDNRRQQSGGEAAEFIQFLIEPASRKIWNECGFDPPGA